MKTLFVIAVMPVLVFGGSLRSFASLQTPQEPVPKVPAQPKTPTQSSAQSGPSASQKYFSDVELVNQDGEKIRFYSDLLHNRTVVIIPFFTTCTGICPPMNATMARIQKELGERSGKEVFLISISVDPMTDTPERLKAYADKFHARPGWSFITGKKENVDWALYKLGYYVEDKNQHSTIMIIGNEATGLWKKAYALAGPTELLKIIDVVAGDKGEPVRQQ